MRLFKSMKMFLGGTLVILLFYGCSSSSFKGRYKKPAGKNKSKKTAQRFSSGNDPKQRKESDNIVFHDYSKSEFDDEPVEEYKIDASAFAKKYEALGELGNALTDREKVLFEIVTYLNTPYLFGGESYKGIDCSGFTSNVFQDAVNLKLPRTASQQFEEGDKISKKDKLHFGDLIFFIQLNAHILVMLEFILAMKNLLMQVNQRV